MSTLGLVGFGGDVSQRSKLERRDANNRDEGRRKREEQPQRRGRDHAHSGNIKESANDHHCQRDHHSAMSFREPGKQAIEIKDEQRRIDGHVENRGHQREPSLLESPEIAHGAPHPGVVAAFVGQRTGKFANHESGGQAPENRGQQQNENAAAIAGAMHDVFCAVGPARHHKEGGGDEWPEREADGLFPGGYDGGWLKLLTRCASCCQFLWLPPSNESLSATSSPLCSGAPGSTRFRAFRLKLVRS